MGSECTGSELEHSERRLVKSSPVVSTVASGMYREGMQLMQWDASLVVPREVELGAVPVNNVIEVRAPE